ncbi:MAG: hypothetical protein JW867_00150 [Candidatus Omnitrophica bacterium]|nr:hypothetical protein [Candidatus Omnitrophota bacterium]
MKKTMLSFFCLFFFILFFSFNCRADALKKADELFEKGVFAQAQAEYEKLHEESSDPDVKWKAFYRSCESLSYLYRYGEACQKLINVQLPEIQKYKIRILILKAETLMNFYLQYANYQREDVIDEKGKEVFSLAPQEIRAEINKAYTQLLDLKNELLDLDLKDEEYFLDLNGVDFNMYPTLYDYLVFSYSGFLLNIESADFIKYHEPPKAEPLLTKNYNYPVNLKDPPQKIAAELLEEASRQLSEKRAQACERLKIKRLLLPARYNFFKFKDTGAQYSLKAKDILIEWIDEFTQDEAKAEAGFEAASILNNNKKPLEALRLCKRIEKEFSNSFFAKKAKSLRLNIELPHLQLSVKNSLPPAKDSFTLTTKNLKKVHFRLYRLEPYGYKNKLNDFNNSNFRGWSEVFASRSSDPDWLKKYTSENKSDYRWSSDTGDNGGHEFITKTISPPKLGPGIYLVLASADESFSIGKSMMQTCILNVSDLILIGTSGLTLKTQDSYYDFIENSGPATIQDYGMRLYTLDAKSGRPLSNTSLNIIEARNYKTNRELSGLSTDKQGILDLSIPVDINPNSYNNNFYFDPLAQHKDSYSYWRNQRYLYYHPENPFSIFIETDRPIYRPGDKVQAKVIVTKKDPAGFRTADQGKVKFTAYDPNGKEFFEKEVGLSPFASASINLHIPKGKLLGNYSLSAQYSDSRFSNTGYSYFAVEEYKRPEFEVKLDEAKLAWKFDEPVSIEGKVEYYFGSPVPDAPVKYKINRQLFIPYCFRYWLQNYYSGQGQEVAVGETKTDSEGKFVISFTPTPENTLASNIPNISQFNVKVESRDSGGRTIEATQSYKASKAALYFAIEPQKGFFLEDEKPLIESKRLTVNDTPSEGKSSWQLYSLKNTPCKTLTELGYGYSDYWGWVPPIDIQLKDIPNDKLISKGNASHDKEGFALIELPRLKQGAYRLTQETLDQWHEEIKQDKVFIVAKDTNTCVPLNAASVILPRKQDYTPGETAEFLIGSAFGSGTYYLELWAGNYLISRRLTEKKHPVQMVELPVTKEMKGGFSLRWFGVKDFKVYHNQTTVSVPFKDKKLTLALEPFDEVLKPGEKAEWGLEVKDTKGVPAQAEALVLMYDRSLEYYKTSNNAWLDNLYTLRSTSNNAIDSDFSPYVYNLTITEGLLEKMLKAFYSPPRDPQLPGIRTWTTWYKGKYRKDYEFNGNSAYVLDEASVMTGSAPAAEMYRSTSIKEDKAEEKLLMDQGNDAQAQAKGQRKNFADSAFFKPHLTTDKNGKVLFDFITPEQLTSWRIKAFAFTQDVKEVTLDKEAVTKKELMVRADIPRFFREKDKGTITAVVHNEADKTIAGRLRIEVKEDGQLVNDKIDLKEAEKDFKIQPHSLQAFHWLISIPSGITGYKVKVSAQSKDLYDSEERELPILPSRERLVESSLVSLSGTESKELKIELKKDPTRVNESMVLEVNPQLTLSLINTIPFLIEYPHECVEQTLNKFVPLSIVNEIYKKYPYIQKAVSKIPKRESVTPPWEKDDPRRLITLMETPWVWQSEGRPVSWPIIDMLDPEIVKVQKETTFEKLKSAQLSNGAFPWWPGGEADPYITLYVLAGFSEARRYGVEVPKDIIDKALAYVNKEIPLLLKPEERYLSLVSYAAYVVTSFDQDEFPQAKTGFKAAKAWVVFLEENLHVLTPFGKAYLSYTYFKLGNKERAKEVLDMALDGWRQDPIAGVYWTPEKYSWVWYSDTVEKHAFFLRTLQELRPEDQKIEGMVQWLLFNRKGNVWKSTKASAAAVYALLDYLNQKGALGSDDTFDITWADANYLKTVKADQWLDEPLRWEKKGQQIKDSDSRVTIEKKGKGLAFASLTWTYSTDQIPEASTPGMLELSRKFYKRVRENGSYHLKPLNSQDKVFVGDQIEVQLKINTRSQFEYMHLKDPKAAGFEAETLLSGWKYESLSFYEEPRDSLTNFFLNWMPHGEYILRYRLRPTKPGIYRIQAATLQSMYSPDMTAHSAGFIIEVED